MTDHLQTIQNLLRHIHRDQTYQRLSNIWSTQVQKDDYGPHSLLIGAQGLVVSHRLSISVWLSTMGKQMLCYKCLWPWSSWILNVLIISWKVPSHWLGSYTRPNSFTELIHFLLETRQDMKTHMSWILGTWCLHSFPENNMKQDWPFFSSGMFWDISLGLPCGLPSKNEPGPFKIIHGLLGTRSHLNCGKFSSFAVGVFFKHGNNR